MGLSKKYRLGNLLTLVTETNANNLYTSDDVRGMTITKQIIPTKANVSNTDLTKFFVVHPKEFIFNPRTHGKKIGFGFNNSDECFIISWNNIAFKVSKTDIVLPEYLFLHFNRTEWDREACFRSWGSSTEVFSWEALCEMELELPSIDIQQKYVAIYSSMLTNQQNYERGLDDLKLTCDAYIENLRRETPSKKLYSYITETNIRNKDLDITNVKGVNSDGNFIPTKANTNGLNFSNYKIVFHNQIAYNPSRINLGSIALSKDKSCIVSPMYITFDIINKHKLLPEYLMMWLKRNEFKRSTLFFATGSVRDIFSFELMQEVKIPIPDLQTQQSIVNIYNAYMERKKINEQLKEQIRSICPILIKGSLEEAKNRKDA